MRIAYLAESAIPSREANSIQVMTMCDAFSKLGHEVTLYARRGPEDVVDPHTYYGVDPSIEIVYCSRPGFDRRIARIAYGWRMARAIASRPLPDLLYGRETYGLAFASRLGLPFVLESHGLPRSRWMRFVQARVSRRSNFSHFVFINEVLKRDYAAAFPWLESGVLRVASSGAHLPVPSLPLDLPRREGALQVGYLGQLFPGKGMEIVVPLAERLPDVDVHVAGGMDEDLAKWKERTVSIDNLRFCGFLPPSETQGFLAAMDVLLMPTQSWVGRAGGGGFESKWVSPLKLFDYMASGQPVVASDLPTIREIVRDQENGLLVSAEDVDSWVRAVEQLEQDPEKRRLLGERARKDLIERYTWKRRAERVLEGVLD